jgi:hypothetical protein
MSGVRAAFLDLAHMVEHLASRPTHVKELVPGDVRRGLAEYGLAAT